MKNINDLRSIYKPTPYTGETTVDLQELVWFLGRGEVDMSPPYQRKSVWTNEQRELFMGHLLSGGELLPIIIQRVPDGGPQEVLDGKQRLETMLAWLADKFPARLQDGTLLRVSDLPLRKCGEDMVPAGLNFVNIHIKYVNMPFEERKQFYVRFNSAGTPHTREELEAALKAKPKK
jgi:hypothetical protein